MKNELPEGWKWKKLGEIATIEKNSIIPDQISGSNQKYIGLENIEKDTGRLINFTETAGNSIKSNKYIFTKEHILYGKLRPYLNKVFLPDFDGICSTDILTIKPIKQKAIREFVAFAMRQPFFVNYANTRSSGANLPRINATKILECSIPVPPLETQQKIVAILEKAEETKKLRAQADELTQKLLESVFLEMFGDPVKNPKNFEVAKLKEVSQIVSGVTKGRKLVGKTTVFVPYLRVANVQDGYLDLNEVKEIEVLPSDVEKYALQEGDVLLTEGGDPDKLGRGAVWNGQVQTCIHQNHIFRVRVNREYLVPEYLSMLTGSTYGKRYFLKSAKQTTGIASINSTQLKNFPALIAPLDLQLKFAEIINQIEKTKQSQQQSSQEINNLFNTLMQKAFTGELVI